jgi:hypothetical protein
MNDELVLPENRAVCEITWEKYGTAGQDNDDNTAVIHTG